jgi:hypothetical protein
VTPSSPTSSSPLTAILFGIGGGLASAALFYSAVRGSIALSILLLLLTPLPSLIAGIGWGLPAAIAAALAGLTAMAFSVSPMFSIGYALALGVPVAGITHLFYLASYEGEGPLRDWYPVGRILAAIALYGAALPILVVALAGGSFSIFEADLVRFLKQMTERAPIGSSWRNMAEPQLRALAGFWVEIMPAAFSSYWTFFIAINVYLAGRIAKVSGLLVRPWPNLHWLSFPAAFALIFAAAVAGILIGGAPRVLGVSAFGAFLVAYLLQGLSVVHAVASARAPWLRFATYATLAVAGYVAVPLTALVGLVENVTRFRARFVPVPPTLPLGSV